jgi:hypothetical protein
MAAMMSGEGRLPRGVTPPGTYAKGGRSPIVYVFLCAPCAGYAPALPEDSPATEHCEGCGSYTREVHRFQALIMSAANGGCMCTLEHPQVTGDLPTEASALAVWTEVKTRPSKPCAAHVEVIHCESWRSELWDDDTPSRPGWQVRCSVHGLLGSPQGWAYEDSGKAQMVATRHRNRHVERRDR